MCARNHGQHGVREKVSQWGTWYSQSEIIEMQWVLFAAKGGQGYEACRKQWLLCVFAVTMLGYDVLSWCSCSVTLCLCGVYMGVRFRGDGVW